MSASGKRATVWIVLVGVVLALVGVLIWYSQASTTVRACGDVARQTGASHCDPPKAWVPLVVIGSVAMLALAVVAALPTDRST